jgi:hypothetical protein
MYVALIRKKSDFSSNNYNFGPEWAVIWGISGHMNSVSLASLINTRGKTICFSVCDKVFNFICILT